MSALQRRVTLTLEKRGVVVNPFSFLPCCFTTIETAKPGALVRRSDGFPAVMFPRRL